MWSWVLEGIGLIGAITIGRKYWAGWVILFGNAILWTTYGWVSKQYGFCVASIPYAAIYARNAVRWSKDHHRMLPEAPKRLSVALKSLARVKGQ